MPSWLASFQSNFNSDGAARSTSCLDTHLGNVVAVLLQIRSKSFILAGDGILESASVLTEFNGGDKTSKINLPDRYEAVQTIQ